MEEKNAWWSDSKTIVRMGVSHAPLWRRLTGTESQFELGGGELAIVVNPAPDAYFVSSEYDIKEQEFHLEQDCYDRFGATYP